jgi:hypothetical protein
LKNKKLRGASAVVLALLLFVNGAKAAMVGGSPGAYLRPATGATALGLGNAWSASPEYLAPWWNPAVIAMRKKPVLSAGLGLRSMGRTDAFASFEFKVPPRVGVGLMVLYRGDPFLNDLYDENENPLEPAAYTTLTSKVAFSYYISKRLSAGGTIGFFFQKLPTNYNLDGSISYTTSTGIGSVSLAMAYKIANDWTVSAVVKDLGAAMTWNIESYWDYSNIVEDKPLPSFTLGSSRTGGLLKKPLIWTADLKGYFVDGNLDALDHPEGVFCSGWEWQYWDKVHLRAGVGDILLNGDLLHDRERYFSVFPCRITGGFSLDLKKVHQGFKLNYGISTDKTWAGIDQQLDLKIAF